MEDIWRLKCEYLNGVWLSNVHKVHREVLVYEKYAVFKYMDKTIYCAFTICIVDKDIGMEIVVIEIS